MGLAQSDGEGGAVRSGDRSAMGVTRGSLNAPGGTSPVGGGGGSATAFPSKARPSLMQKHGSAVENRGWGPNFVEL